MVIWELIDEEESRRRQREPVRITGAESRSLKETGNRDRNEKHG